MLKTFTKTPHLKPVTKWVGGKRQLLKELTALLPAEYNRYFEPFVGGGALLFDLAPQTAVINDLNPELMNLYQVIKDTPDQLIACLEQHQLHNSKDYYLELRSADRDGRIDQFSMVERAARFVYMLKVDFNGIYRVNSKGQFNVPYGRYVHPKIADRENIITVHQFFKEQQITLLNSDFATACETATAHDLVYFDPPYIPLTETANFTSYTKDGFGMADQLRLRDLFFDLKQRGVQVMLSNSDTPVTRKLYQSATIHTVSASRAINSVGSKRGKVGEVIITSYDHS